jgi:hypothetical protein
LQIYFSGEELKDQQLSRPQYKVEKSLQRAEDNETSEMTKFIVNCSLQHILRADMSCKKSKDETKKDSCIACCMALNKCSAFQRGTC